MTHSEIIKSIVINFFGENYVEVTQDKDCYTFTIWFPKVTIKNELGKSHTIYDLFARFNVVNDKIETIGFKLFRTTFTQAEVSSDYAHSHLPGIVSKWTQPCLGSGPIIKTINTLSKKFDEDLWKLFCFELKNYVEVESLHGGPYRRISNITINRCYRETYPSSALEHVLYEVSNLDKELDSDFKRYLIKNRDKFKYAYSNNNIVLGVSYEEASLILGNLIYDYINNIKVDEVQKKSVTYKRTIQILSNFMNYLILKNGLIYREVSNSVVADFRDRALLVFKGKEFKFKMIKDQNSKQNNLIKIYTAKFPLFNYCILFLLNYMNFINPLVTLKYNINYFSNGKQVSNIQIM